MENDICGTWKELSDSTKIKYSTSDIQRKHFPFLNLFLHLEVITTLVSN